MFDIDTIQYLALFVLIVTIGIPVIVNNTLHLSYDLRKDLYKNITIETIRLVVVLYLLDTPVDAARVSIKAICILCGLVFYHVVLDRYAQLHFSPYAHLTLIDQSE